MLPEASGADPIALAWLRMQIVQITRVLGSRFLILPLKHRIQALETVRGPPAGAMGTVGTGLGTVGTGPGTVGLSWEP